MSLKNVKHISVKGIRDYQEDACVVDLSREVFAVIDGLGGHPNGDLAASELGRCLENSNMLDDAIQTAHENMRVHGDNRGACVIAITLRNNTAFVYQAGDCRLTLIEDETVIFKSRDHGYGARVDNCVGLEPMHIEQFQVQNITPGCRLLLTTDGIHDYVDNLENKSFEEIIKTASEHSRDNYTIVELQF